MPTETTSDGFKPVDLPDLLLFIVNRMLDESDRLKLTRTETHGGIEILLTVEDNYDRN